MSKRNNRVGEVHGVFHVLSSAGSRDGQSLWLCECLKCGSTSTRQNRYFRKDRPTPVSCQHCTGQNHFNFKGHKELRGTYLNRIKKQAKKRRLDFELTPKYLWSLFRAQEELCAYTGLRLRFYPEQTASLDRVDSKKGYVTGNVVWCHRDINKMKQDLELNRFLELCDLVKEPSVPEPKVMEVK